MLKLSSCLCCSCCYHYQFIDLAVVDFHLVLIIHFNDVLLSFDYYKATKYNYTCDIDSRKTGIYSHLHETKNE